MIHDWTCTLRDLNDTNHLGRILSSLLKPGHVIGLSGSIGAGKTTLVQAIAKTLGIQDDVQSPTFNLFRMYQTERFPLYHFDCYRLEGQHGDLGFEDYVNSEAISLIEWPEFFPGQLPPHTINLQMTIKDHQVRLITITSSDASFINNLRLIWG